jgi:sucrose phosphorylase
MNSPTADLKNKLATLYGEEGGDRAFAAIMERISRFHKGGESLCELDEKDVFLITYGDQFRDGQRTGENPLQALDKFCRKWLKDCINTVHILPFYPYTSDDGFSVLNYHQVDPALGRWEDIHRLGRSFHLMFDMVINHISAGSAWFQAFLKGENPYRDFFITPPEGADLSAVIRPRTSPLLTPFETAEGIQRVWTTFSADQVDLNFQNPEVLLAAVDVLLDYAAHGAAYMRLDAVAFLWKEIGSECLNLPQTHLLIQTLRRVLDLAAPQVRLITETNIPHDQNISYFGDGFNEGQLVYNFALPPLVLHALISGRVDTLRDWAAGLSTPSNQTHFFNFLASHDGIGINPARGILTDDEIAAIVKTVQTRGGLVSYKTTPDGSTQPYELNINYFDALSHREAGESMEIQISRFLVSQAVLLALKGTPAIYIHSLLGSRGWLEGPALKGQNRAVNREKLEVHRLEAELGDGVSLRSRVFSRFERMLKARRSHEAFSPGADQTVLSTGSGVFSLLRRAKDSGRCMVCCHNFTDQPQTIELPDEACPSPRGKVEDIFEKRSVALQGRNITLRPYQVLWMRQAGE